MTRDYAVINIDDGNDVVLDIKRVLVPIPGPPGGTGTVHALTEAEATNPASTVFGTVSGMRLFQQVASFITTARAYISKGSSEPIKANGLVTGTYAFDYAAGNIHSVTFDATDCALSWSNLPATGNRGSVGLNTTTGGTLPSTLGGSASPDWQVELLSLLNVSDSQTFELWVDDGSTVRIQEYTYSGQA